MKYLQNLKYPFARFPQEKDGITAMGIMASLGFWDRLPCEHQ